MRAVKGRGEPVPSAATRLGVVVGTAYKWLRTSGARDAARVARPGFARLVAASTPDPRLLVRVNAAEIEVRAGFDAELLRSVVAALRDGAADA